MKKVFVTLVVLISVSLSTIAQLYGGGRGNRECLNTEYCQNLNLTEDQKTKIETLRKERTAKFEEINKDTSLSQDQKRTQRRGLAEQHKKSIRQVLTSEQQKLWDDNYKNKAKYRSNNRKSGRNYYSGGMNMKMCYQLDLNDEQKTKIETLRQDTRTQLIAINNDSTVPGYERSIKKRELTLQRDKDILNILTPAQKEEWNKMCSNQDKKQNSKNRSNNRKSRSGKYN